MTVYLERNAESQERPGMNQDEALQPAAISEIVSQKKLSLNVGNQKLGGNGEQNVQKQQGSPEGEDMTLMTVLML